VEHNIRVDMLSLVDIAESVGQFLCAKRISHLTVLKYSFLLVLYF
jgi:hypothetical protein